ncbi:hypothetical protein WT60_13695 [Burkholderia sp. MSMB617WGS]|nr:hypothetical protein WT60_13695 [Burkholderia sp. MSMB617WGS]
MSAFRAAPGAARKRRGRAHVRLPCTPLFFRVVASVRRARGHGAKSTVFARAGARAAPFHPTIPGVTCNGGQPHADM